MSSVKNIERLCHLAITNQISTKDEQTLKQWLQESSENQQYYDELVYTWKHLPKPEDRFHVDIDFEWNKFERAHIQHQNLTIEKTFSLNIFEKMFTPKLRPVYLTGIIAIIIAFGVLMWQKGTLSPYETNITQNGQTSETVLTDGTQIMLNAGSTIKLPKAFSKSERKVLLHGEAYFKVQPDTKPFVVVTEQAHATVLGTEFNVWSRDNETRVVVAEGFVKLTSKKSHDKYVLIAKGQMSRVLEGRSPEPPYYVDSEQVLGWLLGKLIFEKTPLKDAIAEIERHYAVTIQLDKELATRLLTAQFEDQTVKAVLTKICLAFNAEYKFESNSYYLQSK